MTDPLCLGVEAATGRPLLAPSDAQLGKLSQQDSSADQTARQTRAIGESRGILFDVDGDANDLTHTGWGVIFGAGADAAIRAALAPLLSHREREAKQRYRVFEGSACPRPEESAQGWLSRHGVRMDVVDPSLGMPFYLLIVASPEEIGFEFQYGLDLYWGVGRIWFDDVEQFRRYAQSVVQWESDAWKDSQRRIALFAPRHPFDAATAAFHDQVARQFVMASERHKPLGARLGYEIDACLGPRATKTGLSEILTGTDRRGAPALLFSGGHGMCFEFDDGRQRAQQGALVCQDWQGYGHIQPQHWFSAADVPADARVHGTVHFLFACYSGGCTTYDDFDCTDRAPDATRKKLAPGPLLAALPQALMAHPKGGALAVIGHIERAWAYSFQASPSNPQTQGLRDVLTRILRGDRIGYATDTFNMRWAALSAALADLRRDKTVSARVLGLTWIQRNDARNYVVLGDPAVRLAPQPR